MDNIGKKFSCETPESKFREKSKEFLKENFMDIEIRRVSALVRKHKQRKVENMEENRVIKCVKNFEHFEWNLTDDEKIYKKIQLLVVTLYSLMFYEDTQVIGLEKLSKLLLMSIFGFKRLYEELNNQGRIPTLKLVSSMENVIANQSKENLKEFLSAYDFFSERKPSILETVLQAAVKS
ncbi:unnamed protein product [Phyllotreta striolata]|uniref:Uncharacterized protein n=1 Tax=Phyllotreta striolata TaxID=444603 RepID=A0A9N9XIX1_PHYSR|nr:unnamed protein product [Phyllotreta striolata]